MAGPESTSFEILNSDTFKIHSVSRFRGYISFFAMASPGCISAVAMRRVLTHRKLL